MSGPPHPRPRLSRRIATAAILGSGLVLLAIPERILDSIGVAWTSQPDGLRWTGVFLVVLSSLWPRAVAAGVRGRGAWLGAIVAAAAFYGLSHDGIWLVLVVSLCFAALLALAAGLAEIASVRLVESIERDTRRDAALERLGGGPPV